MALLEQLGRGRVGGLVVCNSTIARDGLRLNGLVCGFYVEAKLTTNNTPTNWGRHSTSSRPQVLADRPVVEHASCRRLPVLHDLGFWIKVA